MSPVETKLRSDYMLSEKVGESRAQIQRYIRLTELIPELLQLVDKEKFSFRPAVEISYIGKDEQKMLLDFMKNGCNSPSLVQAEEIKRLWQLGNLTEERIFETLTMQKNKKTDDEKRKNYFRTNRLKSVIPDGAGYEEAEDFLYRAAVFYRDKVLNKNENGL